MSSKASSSKKDSDNPKLPAMETIITRRKSAQLKRQLRNKDQSILKINQMTQLLRSPTYKSPKPVVKLNKNSQKSVSPVKTSKKSVSPLKNTKKSVSSLKNTKKSVSSLKNTQRSVSPVNNVQKSPTVRTYYKSSKGKKLQKSTEKNQKNPSKSTERQSDMKEYYPNKLKRTVAPKKVVLKPKHELKVIATGVSKRKLAEPQKGYVSPVQNQSRLSPLAPDSSSNLTVEELISLQDMDSLNDEDLMEILTCPSPVWWEDPPDAYFDEDPLFTREPDNYEETEKCNVINRSVKNVNYTDDKDKNLIENINCNLKLPTTKGADEKFMKKRNKLENLLGNIKNKLVDESCKAKNLVDSDKLTNNDLIVVDTEIGNEDIKLDEVFHTKNQISPVDKKRYTSNDDKTSESTEEDPFLILRDDDLLNDLENIDIPIESDAISDEFIDVCSISSPEDSFLGSGKDQHKLDPVNKSEIKVKTSYDAIPKIKTKTKKNYCSNTFAPAVKKLKIMSIENLEILAKSSKNEMSDDNYDNVSLVSSLEPDTISDTNITFIDEDETNSSKIVEKDNNTKGKMNNPIKILRSEIGNLSTNMNDIRKRFILEKINKSHVAAENNLNAVVNRKKNKKSLHRISLDKAMNNNANEMTDLKNKLEPLRLKQSKLLTDSIEKITTVNPNTSDTLKPKEKFKQILRKLSGNNVQNIKPLNPKSISLKGNELCVEKNNLESPKVVTNGISILKPNLDLDSNQKTSIQVVNKSMNALAKKDIPKMKPFLIPVNCTNPSSHKPKQTRGKQFLTQSPRSLAPKIISLKNFSKQQCGIPIKMSQNISKNKSNPRPNGEKTECMTVFKYIPKDESNKDDANHELEVVVEKEASTINDSDNATKNTEEKHKHRDKNKTKTNYFAEYLKVINSVKDRLDIFNQDKTEEQLQTNNISKTKNEERNKKNNLTDESLPNHDLKVNNVDDPLRENHEYKDQMFCEETENTDTFCDTCDPNATKSIIVSNSSVKYCLKCSSIFDTDDCSYCQRKSGNQEIILSAETVHAPTDENCTDNNTEANQSKESNNCVELTANCEDNVRTRVVENNISDNETNA